MFRDPEIAKTAVLELLDSPKLISRKIWMIGKSWNFHTVHTHSNVNYIFSILGQYEMGECVRSGFCNFMHLKPISRDLRRELYGRKGSQSGLGQHGSKRDRDSRRRSRSRSRERKRSRSRERRRSRDRAGRSGRYWYYCCFTAFPFANKQFSISLFRSLTYENC